MIKAAAVLPDDWLHICGVWGINLWSPSAVTEKATAKIPAAEIRPRHWQKRATGNSTHRQPVFLGNYWHPEPRLGKYSICPKKTARTAISAATVFLHSWCMFKNSGLESLIQLLMKLWKGTQAILPIIGIKRNTKNGHGTLSSQFSNSDLEPLKIFYLLTVTIKYGK